MLKKLIRKWLGIEQSDIILATVVKRTSLRGTPVYPADDPHPVVKKGYNG